MHRDGVGQPKAVRLVPRANLHRAAAAACVQRRIVPKEGSYRIKTLEHCVSQLLQLTTRTQHARSDGLGIKRNWLAAFQTVGAVTGMQAAHVVSQPLQQVKDIALCLRVHA
eukprot:211021-Chlamydomonas_euryale.AAC.1